MKLLLLRTLRAHRLALTLATVAVALAVAALATQRALTQPLESEVHDLAHALGGNMLVLPAETDVAEFHAQRFGGRRLPADVLERLRASPASRHLREIDARQYSNLQVAGGEVILVGREVDRGGRRAKLPDGTALVGPAAAERLGVQPGGTFELSGVPLRVAGIERIPAGGLDLGVFTSPATARRITGGDASPNALLLSGCWCSVDVVTLAEDVERMVPGSRAVTLKGVVAAQQGTIETVTRYGRAFELAVLLMVAAVIVLLISSQVEREAPTIGVLLAVGTGRGQLVALHLVEALMVALLGAAAGWLLSRPLAALVGSALLGAPASPASGVPWAALGVVVGVALLAALIPSLRISRLDPTLALKENET